MRILLCIPTMDGGGAQRQLTYLASGLTARGVETHVVLTREGPNFVRLQKSGARVHLLKTSNAHSPALLWELRRLVKNLQPDLIHTWLTQMDILGGITALARGVPWVLGERGAAGHYPSTGKNFARALLGSRAHGIISNSAGGEAFWKARARPQCRRYVIPNALPLDEIAATPPLSLEAAGLKPGEKLLIYAGRFHESKNLQTLVLALREVAARAPVRAVFCGEGPDRPRIERLVAENGLTDRVVMMGYVNNVWAWMKQAAVFASVSLVEGHPNTLMEAMACGCPLVVSDIPAHREFVDGQCGLLVPAGDPSAMAAAIMETLDNPEAARQRTASAVVRAQGWSIAAMTGRYLEAYSL